MQLTRWATLVRRKEHRVGPWPRFSRPRSPRVRNDRPCSVGKASGASTAAPGKRRLEERPVKPPGKTPNRWPPGSVTSLFQSSFTKNRHLLGFDNPQKALLTTVKEAVDNSLDACEEAGILPDLEVEITELSREPLQASRVQDNGPGIVRNSRSRRSSASCSTARKFHRLKQQRGQQGIGISAAGMYGQLTTGRPVRHHLEDRQAQPGAPVPVRHGHQEERAGDPEGRRDRLGVSPRGHRVEIELEAVYKKGRRSVDDYIEQTRTRQPSRAVSGLRTHPRTRPATTRASAGNCRRKLSRSSPTPTASNSAS